MAMLPQDARATLIDLLATDAARTWAEGCRRRDGELPPDETVGRVRAWVGSAVHAQLDDPDIEQAMSEYFDVPDAAELGRETLRVVGS